MARISSLKEIRSPDEQKKTGYPEILSTKHIKILPQKSPGDSRHLPQVMMNLSEERRVGAKSKAEVGLKLLQLPVSKRHIHFKRTATRTAFENSSNLLSDSPASKSMAAPHLTPAGKALQTPESFRQLIDNSHSS